MQSAHLPSRLSQIDSLVGCKKQANASTAVATADVVLRSIWSTTDNLPNANWNNDHVNLNRNNPDNSNDNLRGRVWMNGDVLLSKLFYRLCEALSQPPSILPISLRILCIWKILVSFASPNSRNNLSLSVATSSWLLALMRYAAFNDFGAFLAMMHCSRKLRIDCSRLAPREYLHRFSSASLIDTIFL